MKQTLFSWFNYLNRKYRAGEFCSRQITERWMLEVMVCKQLFFLCCFGLRLARPFRIRTRSYLSNFSILQSISCKTQLPGNTSTSHNRDKSKGLIKTHIPDELPTIQKACKHERENAVRKWREGILKSLLNEKYSLTTIYKRV